MTTRGRTWTFESSNQRVTEGYGSKCVSIIGVKSVILIGVFGNDVLLPTHHSFFCHFHEKKFKNELLMSYHHENHVLPADDFFNIKES